MFIWTFLLRITHTIISQSIANSSWITLYAPRHAPAVLSQRKYCIVARVGSWDDVEVLGARKISFLLQGITKKWREWRYVYNPPDWTRASAVRSLFVTPQLAHGFPLHLPSCCLPQNCSTGRRSACPHLLYVHKHFILPSPGILNLDLSIEWFCPSIRFFPVSKGVYISE